uniref:Matrix-remodeling-associated protein 7 helical domain-containing protein n=1 Tax=Meloidogyne incognita TaxID=6306 RepID=A0A914MJA7_MELIC
MTGFFNKSLMESFRQNAKNSGILRDENCPFISRDDLVVIKEEDLGENKKNEVNKVSKNLKSEEEKEEENINYCEGKDDEKMPLLEDINSPPNKKEKKKRKQFKDPDPETAQALNKLVENGLHGKLATAQLRVKTQMLEQSMSEEERIKEQEIRQKQLAEIFQMMEAQKEKFGIEAKEEVVKIDVEQMKLYSL